MSFDNTKHCNLKEVREMKVLIAMSLAAAHDYGVALGAALGRRGHTVCYAAGGVAAEMLAKSSTAFLSGPPGHIMDEARPDVVVACIAGGGADPAPIECALALEALARNIPWTFMEDTEGVASQPAFEDMLWSHHPALVCLTDQCSYDRFTLKHPQIAKGDIEVVGNPTWDAALSVDRKSVREQARSALGLTHIDRLVVYMAGKVGGVARTDATLKGLLPSLYSVRQGSPIRYRCCLAPLFHPGDSEWKATLKADGSPYGCFEPMLKQATERGPLELISRDQLEQSLGTDRLPVLAAADVLVSTASSENTRAVLLRTPVIRPFFPLDRLMLERLYCEGPHYFSDIALGCAIGTRTELELLAALNALDAANGSVRRLMRENQTKYYSDPQGSFTDRIVEMLEQLAK